MQCNTECIPNTRDTAVDTVSKITGNKGGGNYVYSTIHLLTTAIDARVVIYFVIYIF